MIPKAPKLLDCQEHGPHAELFIVEGDSAARTIDRVRNARFQAILPMQGKPLNAMKTGLDSLLENVQFAALISAIGIEPGAEPQFDELRFHDIILLFDPDADGIHSRTLMLLFFYRWLTPLLAAGRISDAYAPQWTITSEQLAKPVYAFTPQHLERVRATLAAERIERTTTIRFRGLSSVGGEILAKLCVDPATRRLSKLTPEDADRALRVFRQMGEERHA
jgi:DNA gyrase/topoisomerase IV subunit B